MSYKLMKNIRDELDKIAEKGLNTGNLDTACKLVDMLKDMENIEYWRCREEYYDDGYSSSRDADNSGRHYVRAHYSKAEQPRMHYNYDAGNSETYSRYMNNKNSYRSGRNIDEKQNMLAALEEHLTALSTELEGMCRDADCKEERAAINRFVQKLQDTM